MADEKPISGEFKWGGETYLVFGPGAPYAVQGLRTEQIVPVVRSEAEAKAALQAEEIIVTLRLKKVPP